MEFYSQYSQITFRCRLNRTSHLSLVRAYKAQCVRCGTFAVERQAKHPPRLLSWHPTPVWQGPPVELRDAPHYNHAVWRELSLTDNSITSNHLYLRVYVYMAENCCWSVSASYNYVICFLFWSGLVLPSHSFPCNTSPSTVRSSAVLLIRGWKFARVFTRIFQASATK